jgi:hypothetical protein
MKVSSDQKGIGHWLLLGALTLIVVVGVAGYRVAHNTNTGSTDNTSISHSTKATPTAIKSKADVKAAAQTLDNTAIDSSVDPHQLDSDLNSLL